MGTGSGFRGGAFHRGRQRLTVAEANVNVFAIRHGETAWSLTGQHTGTTDIPLTDNGRRLAERMRPVLARNAFGLVLCSPMQRARETCELAGLGDKAVIDSDLVEWNYGEYEGLTPNQIHEVAPDSLIFRDGCPGGKAPEQVGARVDRVIARSRGPRRHRAIRARTCAARACSALDRAARGRRPAFSAGYGYLVCPRLLPRDTGRADLERVSHRLERGERDYAMSESKGRDALGNRRASDAAAQQQARDHPRQV
jgi:broad specificity phosphatase PhoE